MGGFPLLITPGRSCLESIYRNSHVLKLHCSLVSKLATTKPAASTPSFYRGKHFDRVLSPSERLQSDKIRDRSLRFPTLEASATVMTASTIGNTRKIDLPLDGRIINHPDSCLGLSLPLIERTAQILPHSPHTIVSIGTGTGLFEALLLQYDRDLILYGVEVQSDPPVNRHIPEQYTETVGGTWDISSLAKDAAAWMFVYPRNPKLLRDYFSRYSDSKSLEMVIWLGPKEDWAIFEPCFCGTSLYAEKLQDAPLRPYEMMVVYRTKGTTHIEH